MANGAYLRELAINYSASVERSSFGQRIERITVSAGESCGSLSRLAVPLLPGPQFLRKLDQVRSLTVLSDVKSWRWLSRDISKSFW